MAVLVPWRALYYNPEKINDLGPIVTPPYDVITPEQRRQFEAQHPFNVIRLILPQPLSDDPDSRYQHAALTLQDWRRQDILRQDTAPALYYWETDYSLEGRIHTRRAVVGLIRLESLESGVVRPHEKTFSAHKTDRFKLMQQVRAQLSAVFALYPDAADVVLTGLRQGLPEQPLYRFQDYEGSHHRFYRVSDPMAWRAAAAGLADLPIFIADGHHRYETALAYRDWLQKQYPEAPPNASFHYVLMYLSNMFDAGLIIRPAHRLLTIRHLSNVSEEQLFAHLPYYFDMVPLTLTKPLTANAEILARTLAEAGRFGTAFILVTAAGRACLLRPKAGIMASAIAAHLPAALTKLDVVVLNFLVFDKVLGLSSAQQDDSKIFQYDSTIAGALAALEQGKVDLAFLLNPTHIEHVQEVASSGLIMPRKSTYFYPKVPVGPVMHLLDPTETVGL